VGPSSGPFPQTRHSVIAAVKTGTLIERRDAYGGLVSAYWKPVFKYIRLKWRAEHDDAADLTQAFFTKALEKDFFAAFDPARARFRTFLRTCVDGFVANERKAARRLKRGGEVTFVSIDFAVAERELEKTRRVADADFETFFHREWLRSLLGTAVERMRAACAARGRTARFAIFERYDLVDERDERPVYAEIARELGLSAATVANELAAARREFRRLVLEVLREQCATDEEFEDEARALVGRRL